MWTYCRIVGGAVFVLALFLRPLKFKESQSAFQLAAAWNDFESIAVFLGSVALGVTASISTFFTKRVIDWLETTLTLLGIVGIVFFAWRFGVVERHGISLSWAGLLLVLGLGMIALGAHGRYRNQLRP